MSENVALDELSDAGLAAPVDGTGLAMDRSDLDHGAFSLLDDAVLHSGRLADVVDTAAFWSGVSDSFQPLIGLSTMVSEFTSRANFSLAPALAGIELAVPRLPNIGEVVGQSLLDGLGAHNASLSALADVRPQILSLSESVNSVLPSVANTLGLLDGLNLAKAVLSAIEPQVRSLAGMVGPAALSRWPRPFSHCSVSVNSFVSRTSTCPRCWKVSRLCFPLCRAWRQWQKRSHHTSPFRWKYRG
ncbi:hypothetical protein [Streptomyces albidoflavus]|uniref:hypothetical protein n=1 Tax=Streptomyces albidoflavus TaxID=1886 RepID=UPI001F5DF165|nr:hypothetical protein [Streptomyces albidoflavus]